MLATRALRPLATLTTRRPLSQLVVSVVGPDRGGLVSSVTRAIAQHDGNVVESSSFSIGPVFSMAMLVEAGADQHAALTSAVQSAVPGHSVSAHEAEECVEAPAFAAALDVSCADGVGLIARVTEFVANEGLSLSKLETKTEGAPHGGTQLFSLSGVMLSKDRADRCLNPTSRLWRRGSLAARRVDGVAARVSRRSSRRWRGGAGLSSPVASMALWVSRRSARLTGRFHRRQRGQARARLQGPRARDGREHRHVRLRRRRGREDGRLAAC
jgi:glycine cleavage system transcriptional repressor